MRIPSPPTIAALRAHFNELRRLLDEIEEEARWTFPTLYDTDKREGVKARSGANSPVESAVISKESSRVLVSQAYARLKVVEDDLRSAWGLIREAGPHFQPSAEVMSLAAGEREGWDGSRAHRDQLAYKEKRGEGYGTR